MHNCASKINLQNMVYVEKNTECTYKLINLNKSSLSKNYRFTNYT